MSPESSIACGVDVQLDVATFENVLRDVDVLWYLEVCKFSTLLILLLQKFCIQNNYSRTEGSLYTLPFVN